MAAGVDAPVKHSPSTAAGRWLAVLGVVYGDIGTSPLYALKSSMQVFNGVPGGEVEILGILSLFFWSLVLVVTVKYVMLVMRADNHGEGGILALMALAQRVAVNTSMRNTLAMVGIVGACLFFGDGVITPAISVLSAVEGLEVAAPTLQEYVLPISVGVIIALFAMQYRGTHSVGRVFGPIMALWFIVLALLGIGQIIHRPDVLMAISPWHAVKLCVVYKYLAFVVLGAVVLCVTGAEALYADMGHFGPIPIRQSWLFVVLPSLVLCYFGQGAMLLRDPASVQNPFFLMAPEWSRLALVILATAATVIASQAVISGAYSATRQCMQLGFLPRLTVRHTSNMEEGQIYVPQVNMALMIGVL
ncbi:MAG TPA: KUP/HAK/KT family potassium transporter, partial [Acetobacteraceae bacterium]|nr:KUP/HAK/KT family potassium transporter [Acetobacteraceae bacterium]